MKTPVSRILVRFGLFLGLAFQASTLHSQGTAFTYQGRLNDGAAPANGNYDLRFAICDSPSGGLIVGGPLTNAPTVVSNGLFTVTLDPGAGVFAGPARWLEIGVRTNGSASAYQTLGPRQPLTATLCRHRRQCDWRDPRRFVLRQLSRRGHAQQRRKCLRWDVHWQRERADFAQRWSTHDRHGAERCVGQCLANRG